MFEILTNQLNLKPSSEKFPDYFSILNSKQLLSSQSIILNENDQKRSPFNNTTFSWWDAYNDVKHSMPDGIFKATLENVIDSLGALFILHHIADFVQSEKNPNWEKLDFWDSKNWVRVETKGQYIHYKGTMGINSALYESFQSLVFSIHKRFVPYLVGKEHEIWYPKN